MKLIKSDITREEAKDSGLALTLIALYLVYRFNSVRLLLLPGILLLLCMMIPGIFRPFARLWFGLSAVMGSIASRVVLTVVFFTVVTPVGLIRRLSGGDPLQLRTWKKGSGSVFRLTERTMTAEDLKNPY